MTNDPRGLRGGLQQLTHPACEDGTPAPVTFAVVGVPQTQGSKVVASIAGRRVRIGKGITAIVNPRPVLVEQSDVQSKTHRSNRLKRWRAKVAAAAGAAFGERALFTGPVNVKIDFVFARPPSHWTKSLRLTKSARAKLPRKDLSKLVRAVEDALSGIVYVDDVQVCSYAGTRKRWSAQPDGNAGAFVEVTPL